MNVVFKNLHLGGPSSLTLITDAFFLLLAGNLVDSPVNKINFANYTQRKSIGSLGPHLKTTFFFLSFISRTCFKPRRDEYCQLFLLFKNGHGI